MARKVKRFSVDEFLQRHIERQRKYKENYEYARSLGIPYWLAVYLRAKPKEDIEKIAKQYKEGGWDDVE